MSVGCRSSLARGRHSSNLFRKIKAIEALVKTFEGSTIVADFKTMDGGDLDVAMAKKAGAHVITVMAVAEDATIRRQWKKHANTASE